MLFLLTIQEPNKEPNKQQTMSGYESMTCGELRKRINEFKEYKRNWYFNIPGVSKMKKADLIDICKDCDKADAGCLSIEQFSNKEVFDWILNNDEKKAKQIGLDYTDDEEFTSVQYRYNPFHPCRPFESSVIFVINYEKYGKRMGFSSQKQYNTSSPFALWFVSKMGFNNDTDEDENC